MSMMMRKKSSRRVTVTAAPSEKAGADRKSIISNSEFGEMEGSIMSGSGPMDDLTSEASSFASPTSALKKKQSSKKVSIVRPGEGDGDGAASNTKPSMKDLIMKSVQQRKEEAANSSPGATSGNSPNKPSGGGMMMGNKLPPPRPETPPPTPRAKSPEASPMDITTSMYHWLRDRINLTEIAPTLIDPGNDLARHMNIPKIGLTITSDGVEGLMKGDSIIKLLEHYKPRNMAKNSVEAYKKLQLRLKKIRDEKAAGPPPIKKSDRVKPSKHRSSLKKKDGEGEGGDDKDKKTSAPPTDNTTAALPPAPLGGLGAHKSMMGNPLGGAPPPPGGLAASGAKSMMGMPTSSSAANNKSAKSPAGRSLADRSPSSKKSGGIKPTITTTTAGKKKPDSLSATQTSIAESDLDSTRSELNTTVQRKRPRPATQKYFDDRVLKWVSIVEFCKELGLQVLGLPSGDEDNDGKTLGTSTFTQSGGEEQNSEGDSEEDEAGAPPQRKMTMGSGVQSFHPGMGMPAPSGGPTPGLMSINSFANPVGDHRGKNTVGLEEFEENEISLAIKSLPKWARLVAVEKDVVAMRLMLEAVFENGFKKYDENQRRAHKALSERPVISTYYELAKKDAELLKRGGDHSYEEAEAMKNMNRGRLPTPQVKRSGKGGGAVSAPLLNHSCLKVVTEGTVLDKSPARAPKELPPLASSTPAPKSILFEKVGGMSPLLASKSSPRKSWNNSADEGNKSSNNPNYSITSPSRRRPTNVKTTEMACQTEPLSFTALVMASQPIQLPPRPKKDNPLDLQPPSTLGSLAENKTQDGLNAEPTWGSAGGSGQQNGGEEGDGDEPFVDASKEEGGFQAFGENANSDDGEDKHVAWDPSSKGGGKVQRRATVCAEVFKEDEIENFEPEVVEKEPEVKKWLMSVLEKHDLFSHLEDYELSVAVDAMTEATKFKGDTVFDEEDEENGDLFYLVGDGQLDVTTKTSSSSTGGADSTSSSSPTEPANNAESSATEAEPAKATSSSSSGSEMKSLRKGDTTQETLLMYAQPYHGVGVVAEDDTKIYSLDRITYKCVLSKASKKKRAMYGDFLKEISFLKQLNNAELMQLADALKPATFEANEPLIQYGEQGETFYLIVEGTVDVFGRDDNDKPIKVCEFGKGQNIGELEFLNNHKCVADCKAQGFVRTAKMNKHHFEMVMGPAKELLKKVADESETYSYYREKLDKMEHKE